MKNISVDFNKVTGAVKPMHAVNNGPVYSLNCDQRITNIDSYAAAGIPFARTHDASFYATYGGEHTVDVHAIFPDFDSDPYNSQSYDFTLTDEYLKVMKKAGTEPFYRLGSKIEHWPKKYGTLPPKDFKKWAVICEHIIRHFNYGWADGYHMGITYWEIWNEPDLNTDEEEDKKCWGGTKKQFFELYDITARHLKKNFPELKIGGPALAYRKEWAEDFLAQLKASPDFFSWHTYAHEPEAIIDNALFYRNLLDRNGFTETESILNEWNYVKGWEGDSWYESLKTEKSMKGAAFIAGTMCESQKNPIDMLMYYDARPCGMNGMFDTDFVCDLLKGYYPFYMFNQLYKLGISCECSADCKNIYTAAAKDNDGNEAVMICFYTDEENAVEISVRLEFAGGADEYEMYILDEEHDNEYFGKVNNNTVLTLRPQTVILLKSV